MALQYDRVKETAEAAAELSNQLAALQARVARFLTYNSNQAIDWAAGSKPGYIDEEANGNLSGKSYTRQAVANAIGALDQINRHLLNQTVTQGDYIGVLNQLARPQ